MGCLSNKGRKAKMGPLFNSKPKYMGAYDGLPVSLFNSYKENPAAQSEGEQLAQDVWNIVRNTIPVALDGEYKILPGLLVEEYTTPLQYSAVAGSKIVALKKALELSFNQVRITTKGNIRIEIPLQHKTILPMSSVFDSAIAEKMTLPCAVGMDSSGQRLYIDLAEAPHLLIAGASGSGKSVTLNNILISLMKYCPPQQLKLLLIDPKRVELYRYRRCKKYLFCPVVTESDKTTEKLKQLYDEMERRYNFMRRWRIRDISANPGLFPRIVCAIDEFSALMYGKNKREVEEIVAQLCAKGRACGIHLIICTQSPRSAVITGKIKANIPARLAFAVPSINDSKTILDYGGAEKLSGKGDGLYMSPTTTVLQRFQAAYISDSELDKCINYIRTGRA